MTATQKPHEAIFYYARGTTRFGPIFESDFKKMCRAGQIQADDRVWSQAIGPHWVDAGTLSIPGIHKPGALTPVPDLWVYLLLLSPLISTVLGLIYSPLMVVGGLLLHLVVPALDVAEVRRSGHMSFSKWYYLLAVLILPLYLFFRIRRTQSPHIAALLLYVLAAITAAMLRYLNMVPINLSSL